MSYLNVISLEEAKTHLGIDDDSRDNEITRMVKTCFSKVESDTNHLVYARDKNYIYSDGCIRVYDYPINSTDESTVKTGYSIYESEDSDSITLNVGYEDPANVPTGLADMALILLEQLFFKGEVKETGEYIMLLNQFRRFIL